MNWARKRPERYMVLKMAKTSEIATKTKQVELTNPNAILDFATQLKKLILENKLSSNINGKNYVNVEGWQIAGAFTGTFPVVEKVEDLSTGNTYKYRAEVSLRDNDGQQVGYGVAVCSNREPGKGGFQEYAVASMAQTRAVGKAYRMKIGWLLKVAGYETTPAEEMDAVKIEEEPKASTKSQFSIREIGIAKTKLEQAKTIGELKVIFAGLGRIMNEPEVLAKKDELKDKLTEEAVEVVTAARGGDDE